AGAPARAGERRADALARAAVLVGDGVRARSAVEHVVAAAPDDRVVAAGRAQAVDGLAALQAVVAATADDVLGDDVVALGAAAGAVVGLAVERDGDAGAPRGVRDRVGARPAAERVGSVVAGEEVVARATDDVFEVRRGIGAGEQRRGVEVDDDAGGLAVVGQQVAAGPAVEDVADVGL